MSVTFVSYRPGDADYTTHTLHALEGASQSGQTQVVEVITINGVTYAMVIDANTSSTNGLDGWTPVLALHVDGDRTLARVTDWAGGGGTKPATGMFLGASGFVADQAQAISVRGPKGDAGDIAQLADGSIGKTKLSPSVQESLGKADAAISDLAGVVTAVANGPADKRAELQGLVSGELDGLTSITTSNVASQATYSGYVNASGTAYTSDSSGNWRASGFIETSPGFTVAVNCVGHTALMTIGFYDSTKNFIAGSGVSASSSALPGAIVNTTVTAPANAAFFRISYGDHTKYAVAINSGIVPSFVAQKQALKPTSLPPAVDAALEYKSISANIVKKQVSAAKQISLVGKVINLYGTSISSTDYPWLTPLYQAFTGATTVNRNGRSGASAAQMATAANLTNYVYAGNPDAIIMEIGANDSGAAGTVGTFSGYVTGEPIVVPPVTTVAASAGNTFIAYVYWIVKNIRDNYANIRARAGITGSEDLATQMSMMDAVKKPHFVVLTGFPQKRNNAADAFSLSENHLRKRDAIVEVCNMLGVTCVDTLAECGFDMSLEPFWTSPTSMTVNNGVYFMDGLHPNKQGYRVIVQTVCSGAGIQYQGYA